MDYSFNEVRDSHWDDSQEDDSHSLDGSSLMLNGVFNAAYNPHIDGDAIPTADFMDSEVSVPPLSQSFHNQPTSSSSTSGQHIKKVHPCGQCGKPFPRRALAEGCENRDNDVQPFQCRGRCGDLGWYVASFFP